MLKISTKADLLSLIHNHVVESTTLEYKRKFPSNLNEKAGKKDLAKDISSMANANGGIIIYGMDESQDEFGNKLPTALKSIPTAEMDKERLSQLLRSNIQPPIENIEIDLILDDDKQGNFFIVTVPQSDTAHQNLVDRCYYRRSNSDIHPMEDYEIRDVMNRSKHPVIDLGFKITKTITTITHKPRNSVNQGNAFSALADSLFKTPEPQQEITYCLKLTFINDGKIFAKYVNSFVRIPTDIVARPDDFNKDGDSCVITAANTIRDYLGHNQYGPSRYEPILPGTDQHGRTVELRLENIELSDLPDIKYSVHADNAPVREATIKWTDIDFEEKTKTRVIDPFAVPSLPYL